MFVLALVPLAAASEAPPMVPWGQLQVFTTVYDQDVAVQADPATYGDPEADPGFELARARFGFTGVLPRRSEASPEVSYGLSLGVATPYDALRLADTGVTIVDGFGQVRLRPGVGDAVLSLGLVKVPFSREALMSSQDLVFMERSVGAESLTSVRDVGLLYRQEIGHRDGPVVALSGGVFNGNADFLGDTDPGLMGAVRAELEKGDTYRTWDPAGGVAYGVGFSALLNDELATRTFAWSGDGLVRVGRWSLMLELGMASLSPTASDLDLPEVFAPTRRLAWTAATSWWQPLSDAEEEVPGVEFAVRASAFDDRMGLRDNGDVLIVHAGAVGRSLLPMLDLGVGWIHREELGGQPLPNDTLRVWTQLRPRNRRHGARQGGAGSGETG